MYAYHAEPHLTPSSRWHMHSGIFLPIFCRTSFLTLKSALQSNNDKQTCCSRIPESFDQSTALMNLRLQKRASSMYPQMNIHVISSHGNNSIVVAPGVWMDHPGERFKNTCSWIKPIVASMPIDTRVFMFSYNLEIDGSSLWHQLLDQSVALIRGLDRSREQPGVC